MVDLTQDSPISSPLHQNSNSKRCDIDEDDDLMLAIKLSKEEITYHKRDNESLTYSLSAKPNETNNNQNDLDEIDSLEIAIQNAKLSNIKPKAISWCRSSSGESFFSNQIRGLSSLANKNCITFDQLLDKHAGLESILCSSFSTDYRWLMRQIPNHVAVTVIAHWDRNRDKEGHFVVNPRLTVVHPPLLQYGSMHAKFMLLLYHNKLRVVISSANLTEGDWDGIGQCVWYQDFVKKPFPNMEGCDNSFYVTLGTFLSQMKLSPDFLNNYDFSTATVELVTSVPGSYSANEEKFGYKRLATLLQSQFSINREDTVHDNIYFQTSSLGALNNNNWLNKEFLPAVNMSSGPSIKPPVPNKRKRLHSNDTDDTCQPPFHILFPTLQTVTSSNMNGSDVICLFPDHVDQLPKDLLYDTCQSNKERAKVLLHSKVLCRVVEMHNEEVPIEESSYGWCYVGSHNLSPSAWGKTYRGQYTISNYEIGVVFVNSHPEVSRQSQQWLNEIPFKIPPQKYSGSDEPWIVSKYHNRR